MTDRYKEYVEQARSDGREVLRRYANGLRFSEGSRERNTNKYFVTVTDEFVETTGYSGGFHKIPQEAIIY